MTNAEHIRAQLVSERDRLASERADLEAQIERINEETRVISNALIALTPKPEQRKPGRPRKLQAA